MVYDIVQWVCLCNTLILDDSQLHVIGKRQLQWITRHLREINRGKSGFLVHTVGQYSGQSHQGQRDHGFCRERAGRDYLPRYPEQ